MSTPVSPSLARPRPEAVDIVQFINTSFGAISGVDTSSPQMPSSPPCTTESSRTNFPREVRRRTQLHREVVLHLQRRGSPPVASTPIDSVSARISRRQRDRQLGRRGERPAGELTPVDVGICPRDQHVVDRNAVDDVEHPPIAIDDPVLAVGPGEGGDRLALADVDEHVVGELRRHARRLDPGDALELRSIARVSTSRIASPFRSSTIADSRAGSVYTAPCTSTVRTSNSDDARTATAPTSTTRIAAAIATQISRLRPLARRTAIRRARTLGSIDPVDRAGSASMLPLSSRSLMMIVDRPPESSSWHLAQAASPIPRRGTGRRDDRRRRSR